MARSSLTIDPLAYRDPVEGDTQSELDEHNDFQCWLTPLGVRGDDTQSLPGRTPVNKTVAGRVEVLLLEAQLKAEAERKVD